jgi:hypothetical protein
VSGSGGEQQLLYSRRGLFILEIQNMSATEACPVSNKKKALLEIWLRVLSLCVDKTRGFNGSLGWKHVST